MYVYQIRGSSRGRHRQVGIPRRKVRKTNSGAPVINRCDSEESWEDKYNDDSTLSSPPPFFENVGPSAEALSCDKPDEFFRLLVTDGLLDFIVENTNLYAHQQGVPVLLSRDEILSYFGMNIAMGIVSLPEISDYWSREPMLRVPWFPSVISRNKFLLISRYLHFADNSKAPSRDNPNYDKLWKIREVV